MKTDKNMYFIDSEGFLGGDHIATADGTHPTDLGFTRMLEVISPKLKKILKNTELNKFVETCDMLCL